MTTLRKNIDKHMALKGIMKYSDLLRQIALHLGKSHEDSYKFATTEKHNFSKMLKGERNIKYEFIVPLEKILGVSLAQLLKEDPSTLSIDKNLITLNKSLRYYAYIDDPKLYKEELNTMLAIDGKPIVFHNDEFGKSFLDYVIEFNAVNGLRYLCETYQLKNCEWIGWYSTNPKHIFYVNNKNNGIELARMIVNLNDPEFFYDFYDSYLLAIRRGFYLDHDIYTKKEFLEFIINDEKLFNMLFEKRKYTYSLTNMEKRKKTYDTKEYNLINPLINNCLNLALNNLDKYKAQAKRILEFGANHNIKVLPNINHSVNRYVTECGGLLINNELVDILIIVENNILINDKEIIQLVNDLPRLHTQ